VFCAMDSLHNASHNNKPTHTFFISQSSI